MIRQEVAGKASYTMNRSLSSGYFLTVLMVTSLCIHRFLFLKSLNPYKY
jgi:hypothetical protein